MEYRDKTWLNLNPSQLKIVNSEGKLLLENKSGKHSFVVLKKVFLSQSKKIHINFKGEENHTRKCLLKVLNRKKEVLLEMDLNTETFIDDLNGRLFILVIYLFPNVVVSIDSINLETEFDEELIFKKNFKRDTLLVSPVYPSDLDKYQGGFVHTRVKGYIKNGLNLDVTLIGNYRGIVIYEYEGVKVFKASYYYLRRLFQEKTYKRVLIHFFDENYANVLDSCDLTKTKLYFYLHGAETLYWDWSKISSPYFQRENPIPSELMTKFKYKDSVIKKYNQNKNAKWIFVTPWTRKRSEELIGIKYNNSECIPCLIDETIFKYKEKDSSLRRKIFVLRKFENINSYALDIVVRVILELSRREFFNQLEIDIYGDGSLFDTLLEPVKNFENVKLHRKFLNHRQIKKVHDSHGIALFPTRFDSQAVSSCEAASSGCVVISSKNPGVEQYIPSKYGTLCDVENYKQYADLIEDLFYDEKKFVRLSQEMPKVIRKKCSDNATILKEIRMFSKDSKPSNLEILNSKVSIPAILSIIIPAYNVERYLRHTVISLINHSNINKIEVIIVNDGSIDRTREIAEDLIKSLPVFDRPIIKLINKENGGHGSAINTGVSNATGKYIKIVDGDDTVDSTEFSKLIDYLESEDSDVVLTDYIEDYARSNEWNVVRLYDFLSPGVQYNFDDLCFENYGFKRWGPILATSCYKAEIFKKNKILLLEKTYYVDMILNTYVALFTKTVKYFPLVIYRYLLGKQDQSVSKKSYTKNYKDHEKVTMEILRIFSSVASEISENKKKYLIDKIIIPMITTQYSICIDYVKRREAFISFDSKLKKYPEFYNRTEIKDRKDIKKHRLTKGLLKTFNICL